MKICGNKDVLTARLEDHKAESRLSGIFSDLVGVRGTCDTIQIKISLPWSFLYCPREKGSTVYRLCTVSNNIATSGFLLYLIPKSKNPEEMKVCRCLPNSMGIFFCNSNYSGA